MERLHFQIHDEIHRILDVVCDLTRLPSNWNGTLVLVDGAEFRGRKPFSCTIEIDADLATLPNRWATLIHEALHAVSAGYDRNDFQQFRGWKEGTVEQLQRLLRPSILDRLGFRSGVLRRQFCIDKETVMSGNLDQERQVLTEQVLDATTLDEVRIARRKLREWVAAHPEEREWMRDGFEQCSTDGRDRPVAGRREIGGRRSALISSRSAPAARVTNSSLMRPPVCGPPRGSDPLPSPSPQAPCPKYRTPPPHSPTARFPRLPPSVAVIEANAAHNSQTDWLGYGSPR